MKDKKPIEVDNYDIWSVWMSTNDITLVNNAIPIYDEENYPTDICPNVSTVFLGIDPSIINRPSAQPLVFETMVFGGPFSDDQKRAYTWEGAVLMHRFMCGAVKACKERNKFINYE